MPELPEVETTKEGLKKDLEGQKILKIQLSNKKLRFPYNKNFIKKITGEYILSITRRAKYILFDLSNGMKIISHLGMSGSYRIIDKKNFNTGSKIKHDHFVLHTEEFVAIYNDPRRFGYILLQENSLSDHERLSGLGYEPLSQECNAKNLSLLFHKKERNIKNTLLDQKIIAGLGNIYVCEALFKSGISPLLPAKKLVNKDKTPKKELIDLVKSIKKIIKSSIKLGGSSFRDYVNTEGKMGYFQSTFNVYGREGKICVSKGCSESIKRIVQSNRSSFFCSSCQKK